MDVQQALDKLKEREGLRDEIAKIGGRYEGMAEAFRNPLQTRIGGGKAPMGYGTGYNLDPASLTPLSDVGDLLFRYQSTYDMLKKADIADDNIKKLIRDKLAGLR